jgi:hypothetical protein
MKRWIATLLLTIITATFVFAQTEDDIPIPPKRSRAGKVGAFGGFTPGVLFVDVKPINEMLVGAGAAGLKEDGVFLWGGGGAAYIMLIPNLRVGGLGMSGSISSTMVDRFDVRKDAQLKVGFGGVTIEYVIPVVERLDVAVGTMIGGGGIDIVLRQDAGGPKTWTKEWGNFGSGNYQLGPQITQIKRTLSGSYFMWIPSLNVEYSLLGWVGARLGVSYVGMSAPSWTVDDNYELIGVPSKVSGRGVMINAGLFVGTF